jgi:hypothetical protein
MGLPEQDTQRRHGLEIAPATSVASPTQMPAGDGDVPWWTPTWTDLAWQLGWKWIFALPAVVVLGLLVGSLWNGAWLMPLWFVGIKIVSICVVIPFLLLLEMARQAICARKEPFCIHCGYGLSGLPDNHTCPECGRAYSFAVIEEYRRDPHWFRQRYKMRGQMPQRDAPFHAGSGPTTSDGT